MFANSAALPAAADDEDTLGYSGLWKLALARFAAALADVRESMPTIGKLGRSFAWAVLRLVAAPEHVISDKDPRD